MFHVSGLRVAMTRGDSGILTLYVRTAYRFTDADRAVFTLRRPGGGTVMRVTLRVSPEGWTQVPFTNEMTERFSPGRYEWDVRYALDATLDEEGNATGGREIITPMRPSAFEVRKAVGSI